MGPGAEGELTMELNLLLFLILILLAIIINKNLTRRP